MNEYSRKEAYAIVCGEHLSGSRGQGGEGDKGELALPRDRREWGLGGEGGQGGQGSGQPTTINHQPLFITGIAELTKDNKVPFCSCPLAAKSL
ncbi:hypothetical protein Chro_0619 [Chroococcidiopsis thermalis PCC 7203]|uniref:Uncharacterized protein n=1 Tax=Chroococcidiopsis thermalis (strain PCC 7203) TaxID=251229 RepID=K9TUC8_CHRTP|nr:hypothetical protein Chro_0619 [Chroococcidiopsis thermalis PCC 7203]